MWLIIWCGSNAVLWGGRQDGPIIGRLVAAFTGLVEINMQVRILPSPQGHLRPFDFHSLGFCEGLQQCGPFLCICFIQHSSLLIPHSYPCPFCPYYSLHFCGMIKHATVVNCIATGLPFDCTYCKTNGELTEFTNAKKLMHSSNSAAEYTDDSDAVEETAPGIKGYLSLIPIESESGRKSSIYTRLILKFNGEDVVL